jgi:transcriptional regulator with XRE-family HTH domain
VAPATILVVRYGQLAQVVRTLRHRASWTQAELGRHASVSRGPVQRLEAGRGADLTGRCVEQILDALGARMELLVRWRGAEIDRLLDEGHARLVAEIVRRLERTGWIAQVEVSFAEFGDRGSIDVLAWHAATATLLVVEVKTELGSVEGLLRPLDVKVRWAAKVARTRFGWQAGRVGRLVVFPGDSTVRRQVERHAAVFDAALPARSHEAAAWLRDPRGTIRAIWFLSGASGTCTTRNPSARRRVRSVNRPRSERDQSAVRPVEGP